MKDLLTHPNYSERELIVRLEKIFMCETSQRYAFLYKIGMSHYYISCLNLNTTPISAVSQLLIFIEDHYTSELKDDKKIKEFYNKLIDAILMFKLPPGIPG